MDDTKQFSHHLEMASLHSKSAAHHLQQLSAMHGASGEDDSMSQEMDMGGSEPAEAFAGKETMAEEQAEGTKMARGRRR